MKSFPEQLFLNEDVHFCAFCVGVKTIINYFRVVYCQGNYKPQAVKNILFNALHVNLFSHCRHFKASICYFLFKYLVLLRD